MIIKHIALLLFPLILFCSEQKSKILSDIDELKHERSQLKIENKALESEIIHKTQHLKHLDDVILSRDKTIKLINFETYPTFVVKFELSQSRFSLDITDHIKDAANAIEIEIPVDRYYYDVVKKGQVVTDKFRIGSFVLKGSFSNWKMKVIDKYIISQKYERVKSY